MKRLTKKIDNGRFVTTDAEARSYGETDPEDGFFYNYFTGEAVDRLAAYEDTGLEPADIEELLAAVPKWISVEERLPNVGERVLACVKIYEDELSVWDGVRWNGEEWEAEEEASYEYWVKINDPVTHWMPLPEAPKEVE